MVYCERCKRLEICERVEKGIAHSCVGFTRKKTNGDSIRHMTDEELANFMYEKTIVNTCPDVQCEDDGCKGCWQRWIRQEVKDDA